MNTLMIFLEFFILIIYSLAIRRLTLLEKFRRLTFLEAGFVTVCRNLIFFESLLKTLKT